MSESEPLRPSVTRLTPSEIERLSYIEDWTLPNGQPLNDLLKADESQFTMFPSPQQEADEVDSVAPAVTDSNESILADWPKYVGALDRRRLEFVVQYAIEANNALYEHLQTIYQEFGVSPEDARKFLIKLKVDLPSKNLK